MEITGEAHRLDRRQHQRVSDPLAGAWYFRLGRVYREKCSVVFFKICFFFWYKSYRCRRIRVHKICIWKSRTTTLCESLAGTPIASKQLRLVQITPSKAHTDSTYRSVLPDMFFLLKSNYATYVNPHFSMHTGMYGTHRRHAP